MPNLSITISNENFIRVVKLAGKEKKTNISGTINQILDGFFEKKERKEGKVEDGRKGNWGT